MGKEHAHNHDHSSRGEYTELYFAIGSGIFWFLGLAGVFINSIPENVMVFLFLIAFFLGAYYTVIEVYEGLSHGKFEIDFLMIVAALGALALGKWGEGSLLLFLFSLGHALEHHAMNRARKSISALSDLAPSTALRRQNGDWIEIPVEDLHIGDLILIKPNTKISADGIIIKGNSAVDQSSITGESIPVSKIQIEENKKSLLSQKYPSENKVFAGTINGPGVLEVSVSNLAKDSTLSKLITLVKEAESQKSPTQHLTDKFERFYVPAVLLLVLLLCFSFLIFDEPFKDSFYRAMAVLIAASPCALAISTPSAVLAGVARAAKAGVLIKGGRPLEELGNIQAIAFDKTGTLTEGRPKLTHVIPYHNVSKQELLVTAIAVEQLSDHPLASAIVKDGKDMLGDINLPEASDLEALIARGIRAKLENSIIHIGNRRLFEEITNAPIPEEINREMTQLENAGHTAMIVHKDKDYLGIITVMDIARKEAKPTLQLLKDMGIKQMVMLTGDNQNVANAVAKDIGITDPMGSLLPEDKVNTVHILKNKLGAVAMVGDGVNDAPAMAKSNVGIAMGAAGSDVALETADIALMADKLSRLPFAVQLSRKAKLIIKQNLWISLGMVAILIPLTILDIAEIGPAVIAHEGSTLVVVLNALRLLRFEFSP